ncbi:MULTISPECIES: mandelate racemase/muconate lactonizing enzyme family protein [unclassified Streptomyces]|uniref:mandelate racemase/muconate lactonizing enzyme family protein n=1 Tax=unclassified Streptomyces TaxID=2593676 RepID=UPI002E1131DD|nr:mandelate racemase/muconate lactonizing enzyme family protein [Streptomyces sp. NBC_01201]
MAQYSASRRTALTGLTALTMAPLLAAAAPAAASTPPTAARRLRVTGMEVFVVRVNHRGNWIFVRLLTDRGVHGLGEASQGGGTDEEMERELDAFFAHVRGRSPFDIAGYRRAALSRAARGKLSATAFAALEQAQWDIVGKALDAPVAELLAAGRKPRTRLPVYANINRATVDRTPAGFAANARAAVADGFGAIKAAVFDDFPELTSPADDIAAAKELGIARTEAIRTAIGPDIALMVDAHTRFDVPLAIEVADRFKPLDLEFYEEPVPPQNLADTRRVKSAVNQQLAGGEELFGRDGFAAIVRERALDIIMPDIKHCGGLLEARRIADLAHQHHVQVSPHNPSGPVSTAISAHLCAGLPNLTKLEYAWGEVPWRAELLASHEQFEEGTLVLPKGSGFGIELDDAAVNAHT